MAQRIAHCAAISLMKPDAPGCQPCVGVEVVIASSLVWLSQPLVSPVSVPNSVTTVRIQHIMHVSMKQFPSIHMH